jgi:arylsulfatase A-like enzyme
MKGFRRLLPKALAWVRAHRNERFFLFLHTYDVHSKGPLPQYVSPPPFRGAFSDSYDTDLNVLDWNAFAERFRRRGGELSEPDKEYIRATYAEGVRFVDEELKQFFDSMKKEGVYEGSLILIWSDHGEGLFDHDSWVHGELYDHTIRVPLLMKAPGVEGGKRVRSVVSAVDIAPTILELARAPIPDGLDGRSLLPLLRKDRGEGAAFTTHDRGRVRLFSIRSALHHYIWDAKTSKSYLFDLREDPREERNLSPSSTEIEEDLRRRLLAWVDEYNRARNAAVGRLEPPSPDVRERLRALGYVDEDD